MKIIIIIMQPPVSCKIVTSSSILCPCYYRYIYSSRVRESVFLARGSGVQDKCDNQPLDMLADDFSILLQTRLTRIAQALRRK